MIRKISLFAAIFALFFAASLCFAQTDAGTENPSGTSADDAKTERSFVIAGVGENVNLNPHTADFVSEVQILSGLYEGLFSYNPQTLEPDNALAESYKISRDKKRWTFTIRSDAKFSSGKQISAETIKSSWLLLQKTRGASYASLLDCIKGMKEYREGKIGEDKVGITANKNTLIVYLNAPTAHLPKILCHHSFGAFTGETNDFSGAYKIAQKTDDEILLEKNENYWDEKNVAIKNIKFLLSDDSVENAWLLNTGKVDWVMSALDVNVVLNKESIRISAIFGTTYLFFTNKNAPWTDASLRNILLTAVPWDALRADNLIQASTLIYPLAGYPAVNGFSEYSAEEALILMQEYRKTNGIPDDKILELTFGIADNNTFMRKTSLILQEAWKPLGVQLNIQTTPDDAYHASIPYWNCDIFAYSWIGDFADPTAFLELFRNGSTLNRTQWFNKEFEEKLNLASETTDSAGRNKILAEAEQILLDDGMIMPITHSISLHGINLSEVGGWYVNALDVHPLKYLYFKKAAPVQLPNVVMGASKNFSF